MTKRIYSILLAGLMATPCLYMNAGNQISFTSVREGLCSPWGKLIIASAIPFTWFFYQYCLKSSTQGAKSPIDYHPDYAQKKSKRADHAGTRKTKTKPNKSSWTKPIAYGTGALILGALGFAYYRNPHRGRVYEAYSL